MVVLFLFFLSNTILVSGSSLSEKVHQTPADMYKKQGEKAEINCSHSVDNYNQILWYKQSNRQLQLLGYFYANSGKPEPGVNVKIEGGAKKGETCTLTTERLNSSAVYFCAASYSGYPAYFGEGTKLTVLARKITPPTVTVFKPSSKECRNLKDEKERKKTLLCVARDFYPDHVSMFWQVNAKNVTKGVATDPAAWLDNGTYFITSRLRVLAEVWTTPGTNFSCFVSFFNGNKTIKTNETVFAVEAGSDGSVKTRVTYLRSTQSFKLSYTVLIIKSSIYGAFVAFLVWKLQGSTGKQKY